MIKIYRPLQRQAALLVSGSMFDYLTTRTTNFTASTDVKRSLRDLEKYMSTYLIFFSRKILSLDLSLENY